MKRIHAAACTVALITVFSFWSSTLFSELCLSYEAVALVKHAILYGLAALIPAMAVTGASGMAISKSRSDMMVELKKKRMRIIALIGILVMVPAAIFLYRKAAIGQFDMIFFSVQAIELVVGVIQLTLLARNFRSGLWLAEKANERG